MSAPQPSRPPLPPSRPPPRPRRSLDASLGFTRLIVEFGVLSSFLFSLVLFVGGTVRTVALIWAELPHIAQAAASKTLLIAAVEQTDNLLIATALLIISIGMQELFVGRLSNLPDWLHVASFDDLKQKLLGIVVVALAVKFFSVAVKWEGGPSLDILTFGAAVAAVMLAIGVYSYILPRLSHPASDSDSRPPPALEMPLLHGAGKVETEEEASARPVPTPP